MLAFFILLNRTKALLLIVIYVSKQPLQLIYTAWVEGRDLFEHEVLEQEVAQHYVDKHQLFV